MLSRTAFTRLAPAALTARPIAAPLTQFRNSSKKATAEKNPKILLEDADNGFGFIRHNARPPKPRKIGVTEIRGPYYSAMGKRHLEDVFET